MWIKLFLLSFYLFVLFVLSRIIEAFSYYQSGYFSSHLIDPFTLSVQKLKAILDNRGVTYFNVIEKQELSDLVESSGWFLVADCQFLLSVKLFSFCYKGS